MPIRAKRSRPTLVDVAKRAGVSRSAASFVLSGRTDQRISQDVWKRVETAARELGYRPNANARALSTGVSNSILLVSDYIATTSTANSMIAGILDATMKAGKSVLIAETRGDVDIERRVVADMLSRQIDAVVYASMFTRGVEIPVELGNVPLILLNCWTDIDQWPSAIGSVVPDEMNAGREIIQLAIRRGYSTGIAFLGDISHSPYNDWKPLAFAKRLEGICAVLDEYGLPEAELIPVSDWTVQAGFQAVDAILSSDREVRLLICANDQLAFGAYRALRKADLRIGQDIGVISFGNTDIADWMEPGLTSVNLPYYDMGKRAATILTDYLAGNNADNSEFAKVSIHMTVVERESL